MKQILEKLRSAEIKSNEMIQKAKTDASLMIEKEHSSYDKELNSLKQKFEKEKEDKLDKAKSKISSDKEKIIKESKANVASFKKKASAKKENAVNAVIKELIQ
jgi:V/A-type H+/Na+-transporting ATPase subunit G/H